MAIVLSLIVAVTHLYVNRSCVTRTPIGMVLVSCAFFPLGTMVIKFDVSVQPVDIDRFIFLACPVRYNPITLAHLHIICFSRLLEFFRESMVGVAFPEPYQRQPFAARESNFLTRLCLGLCTYTRLLNTHSAPSWAFAHESFHMESCPARNALLPTDF